MCTHTTIPVRTRCRLIHMLSSRRRRATRKRRLASARQVADFLDYSVCQGQAEIGSIGYSALPLNLVQDSFTPIQLLHAADLNVDVSQASPADCNNPTFVANDPSGNHLADIAPAASGMATSKALVPAGRAVRRAQVHRRPVLHRVQRARRRVPGRQRLARRRAGRQRLGRPVRLPQARRRRPVGVPVRPNPVGVERPGKVGRPAHRMLALLRRWTQRPARSLWLPRSTAAQRREGPMVKGRTDPALTTTRAALRRH